MSEATDVYDDITLRLGNIHAVADVIAECDAEQGDVSGAAFAICQMVKDIRPFADKLHSLADKLHSLVEEGAS